MISIFSDAYNIITGANWNQSVFNSACTSFEPTGAGDSENVILAYLNFNYQETEFDSVQDINLMDLLDLDIRTIDALVPNITVISS